VPHPGAREEVALVVGQPVVQAEDEGREERGCARVGRAVLGLEQTHAQGLGPRPRARDPASCRGAAHDLVGMHGREGRARPARRRERPARREPWRCPGLDFHELPGRDQPGGEAEGLPAHAPTLHLVVGHGVEGLRYPGSHGAPSLEGACVSFLCSQAAQGRDRAEEQAGAGCPPELGTEPEPRHEAGRHEQDRRELGQVRAEGAELAAGERARRERQGEARQRTLRRARADDGGVAGGGIHLQDDRARRARLRGESWKKAAAAARHRG
jgi:hypothetical protein